MDDFKLNAEKIIASQKAKGRRAQSPETESNWDSSDPEDNTATQVSSGEEFSIVSTKSQKSVRSNKITKPVKPDTTKSKSPSKPNHATPGKKSSKPGAENTTPASKGTVKAGINVFVDRGTYDSDDQSQKSTSKKTRKKKDENPPYDFRNAIKDEDQDIPTGNSSQRPGRSRKGQTYDPAPPKSKQKSQPEQLLGTGSWDDSDEDENEKALATLRRERDGEMQNNNNNETKVEGLKPDPPAKQEVEDDKTKKRKGFNISFTKKKTEKKTDSNKEKEREVKKIEKEAKKVRGGNKELDVAMTTPQPRNVKASDVALVAKNGVDDDDDEFGDTVISLDSEDRGMRYVYIYHQGNTSHYDTRNAQEEVFMTAVANKSERVFRRCAQELFATLRILVDFVLIFLLEFLRFVMYNIVSGILVGLSSGFGDYFLKPLATALFNGLCQPLATFFFNVGVATRTATRPFFDVLHGFLAEIAMVVRALRLVEVNWTGSSAYRDYIEEV